MSAPHETSAFSPRITPRPEYPSFIVVFQQAAWYYAHDGILGCALVFLLRGPYYRLYDALNWSDRYFFALVISLAHTGTYVIFNGGLNIFEKLGWMDKYKIGRKKAEIPDQALFSKLYTEAAINHFITSPAIALLLFSVATWLGVPSGGAPLPSYGYVAQVCLAAHFVNDVLFYWTHRALHHPALYKRFHKQHHTFRGSVGEAAEYAHPVEVVASNQIPTLGLILAVGSHPLVMCAWLILRLTQTYETHSGYALDGSLYARLGLAVCGASFHDHHHTVNLGNFGAEHMDWLFGTMDHYVRDGREAGYIGARAKLAAD
jgi:methylsterol monooxygenase